MDYLNANDLEAKHFGPQITGPLFLAKGASLGDLRFAPRVCALLRGASLRFEIGTCASLQLAHLIDAGTAR